MDDRGYEKARIDALSLPETLTKNKSLPSVLLGYQSELLRATARNQLVVCEKSRRIGMTWGVGADAVLTAGSARTAGGMDVLYIGYNLDMAREFIDVCAMWARAFMPAASAVQEFLFSDQDGNGQDKSIQAFRIRFASGFEITALTSKPRSLRGRQGYVIFDEAAFHDELDELLKAAIALFIWGGKLLVISTHDGVENDFNQLVQDVREGRRKGEVIRVTFDDAISAGLYERVALTKGLDATPEARQAWIESIFSFYGEAADEELRCIPRAGSGAYFSSALITARMSDAHHIARLTCPDGFELRPLDERKRFISNWLEEHVEDVLKQLDPKRRTGLGEDFARSMDLSVFAIGVEAQDLSISVPLIVELKNCPILQQQQILHYVIDNLPRFNAGKFDASGNGLGLAEWAQEEFGHSIIEAIKISQSWYLEWMPKLKRLIEDGTISLPKDADIRDDLRAVKLVNGVPGIPKTRERGRHGDAAVALAMLTAAMAEDGGVVAYEAAKGARSRFAPPMDDFDEYYGSGRGGLFGGR